MGNSDHEVYVLTHKIRFRQNQIEKLNVILETLKKANMLKETSSLRHNQDSGRLLDLKISKISLQLSESMHELSGLEARLFKLRPSYPL
jgi:hypothetical protein